MVTEEAFTHGLGQAVVISGRPRHRMRIPENDAVLIFLDAQQEVLSDGDCPVQLGEPMQIIDGRFRGPDDEDATEEKHQGKNTEP